MNMPTKGLMGQILIISEKEQTVTTYNMDESHK